MKFFLTHAICEIEIFEKNACLKQNGNKTTNILNPL
jgi:hypothetical protein